MNKLKVRMLTQSERAARVTRRFLKPYVRYITLDDILNTPDLSHIPINPPQIVYMKTEPESPKLNWFRRTFW